MPVEEVAEKAVIPRNETTRNSPFCGRLDLEGSLAALGMRAFSLFSATCEVVAKACSYSHFQSANCWRSLIFMNLPTEVRGISFAKTKASGNCHFANFVLRNWRRSSELTFSLGLRTTTASGRSCHLG
jgi:hypothetical protein